MDSDNISYQNMDSWRGSGSSKFGLSFKQIVLEHLRRCTINGSVEWHGGYWNETGYNPPSKTYVPNSRETYSNSIQMLRALLKPYFDKPIIEQDKKIKKELDERFNKYTKDFEDADRDDRSFLRSEYQIDRVNLFIQLFEELVMLSKRLNFFEELESEEEQ